MVEGDEEEQDGEELVAREVRSARRAKTAPLPCPPRNTRTPRSPAQCPPRASFMWLVGRDGAKRLCLNSGRVPCHVCLAQTACLSHGCTPLSACLHRAPLPTHSTTHPPASLAHACGVRDSGSDASPLGQGHHQPHKAAVDGFDRLPASDAMARLRRARGPGWSTSIGTSTLECGKRIRCEHVTSSAILQCRRSTPGDVTVDYSDFGYFGDFLTFY